MPTLSNAERKALWSGSRFKAWHGEVHFQVLVWDGAEPDEVALFEEREDAEAYDREKSEEGFFTSGVQLKKGSCPIGEGVE